MWPEPFTMWLMSIVTVKQFAAMDCHCERGCFFVDRPVAGSRLQLKFWPEKSVYRF